MPDVRTQMAPTDVFVLMVTKATGTLVKVSDFFILHPVSWFIFNILQSSCIFKSIPYMLLNVMTGMRTYIDTRTRTHTNIHIRTRAHARNSVFIMESFLVFQKE